MENKGNVELKFNTIKKFTNKIKLKDGWDRFDIKGYEIKRTFNRTVWKGMMFDGVNNWYPHSYDLNENDIEEVDEDIISVGYSCEDFGDDVDYDDSVEEFDEDEDEVTFILFLHKYSF